MVHENAELSTQSHSACQNVGFRGLHHDHTIQPLYGVSSEIARCSNFPTSVTAARVGGIRYIHSQTKPILP